MMRSLLSSLAAIALAIAAPANRAQSLDCATTAATCLGRCAIQNPLSRLFGGNRADAEKQAAECRAQCERERVRCESGSSSPPATSPPADPARATTPPTAPPTAAGGQGPAPGRSAGTKPAAPAAVAPSPEPPPDFPRAEPAPPRNVDVVGVRLGMTLPQAQEALKAHNPRLRFRTTRGGRLEMEELGFAPIVLLEAGEPDPKYATTGQLDHAAFSDGAIELIKVHAQPGPHPEVVTRIDRELNFAGRPNERPATAAVVESLTRKYGTPSIRSGPVPLYMRWTLDTAGRPKQGNFSCMAGFAPTYGGRDQAHDQVIERDVAQCPMWVEVWVMEVSPGVVGQVKLTMHDVALALERFKVARAYSMQRREAMNAQRIREGDRRAPPKL